MSHFHDSLMLVMFTSHTSKQIKYLYRYTAHRGMELLRNSIYSESRCDAKKINSELHSCKSATINFLKTSSATDYVFNQITLFCHFSFNSIHFAATFCFNY